MFEPPELLFLIIININVFMAFVPQDCYQKPHISMAETCCQTYNNLAAILDTNLSK